jgi:hypothetical protein
VKGDARIVDCVEASQTCPYVNVSLTPQLSKDLFDPRVLFERLNEGTDGVQRRKIHLLFEISKVPGREAAVNPFLIILETKFGIPNQEIVGSEAVERAQPGSGGG